MGTRKPVSGAIDAITLLVNTLQPQATINIPKQVGFIIHFNEGEPWKTQAWNTLKYLCKRVSKELMIGFRLKWFLCAGLSSGLMLSGKRCLVTFTVCTTVMFCLCSEMIMKWSCHDPSQSQSGLFWYWHSVKSFVSNRILVLVLWCWLFFFFSYHTH